MESNTTRKATPGGIDCAVREKCVSGKDELILLRTVFISLQKKDLKMIASEEGKRVSELEKEISGHFNK